MKSMIAAVAVAAAALFGASASADTGGYGSVGYTHFDADDVELGGITGRLGYRFHPNFAVEGEATVGVQDDDVPVGAVRATVELDYAAGLHGVGYLPVSDKFDLFSRIGYQTVEGEASAAGISAGADDDGFAYGVGAQFFFTERFGVRGDYTRLDGDGDEVDTSAISGVVKF
jgi:opacity protein-like surface antigen